MTQLTEHFALEEFTRNSRNIPNDPSDDQIASLTYLAQNILEPIRAQFGPVIITSGFRCPTLNKAVGGAASSQHTKGEASDIHIEGVANADLWHWIVDNLNFDQVIAEQLNENNGAAGWVHVSGISGNNRKDAISFLGQGKYVKGFKYA